MDKKSNIIYCECECLCPSHLVKFELEEFEDSNDKQMSICIQLKHWKSWHRRFLSGIKYIFGKQEKYGHWDSALLSIENAKKLQKLLDKYVE